MNASQKENSFISDTVVLGVPLGYVKFLWHTCIRRRCFFNSCNMPYRLIQQRSNAIYFAAMSYVLCIPTRFKVPWHCQCICVALSNTLRYRTGTYCVHMVIIGIGTIRLPQSYVVWSCSNTQFKKKTNTDISNGIVLTYLYEKQVLPICVVCKWILLRLDGFFFDYMCVVFLYRVCIHLACRLRT